MTDAPGLRLRRPFGACHGGTDVGPVVDLHQRGSTVDQPVFCPSHISVSSEDDFVDDADIPGLHEEDPAGASADPDSPSEEAVPGDLQRDVKLEHEVKSEEALVDDCSLAPTLLDVGITDLQG